MQVLSRRHRLALRAALLKDARGRAAFAEWSDLVPLSTADDVEFRVLPLIYRRLVERGETPKALAQLKGTYRHVWSHNTMLLGRAAEIVRLLAGAGIDTLLLKGMAMFACRQQTLGPRFMRDIDVLVPKARAREAARLLLDAGWNMGAIQIDQLSDGELDWWPGAPMRHPHGYELDLHWQALHRGTAPQQDACFWESSVEIEPLQAKTRRLVLEDQLYHALLHGARWTNGADLDTAVDVCSLLDQGREMDWSRILGHVKRDQSACTMTEQLAALQNEIDLVVPLLPMVCAMPVSRPERAAFDAYQAPAFVPQRGAATMVNYQHFLVREDLKPGVRSTLSFLCDRAKVDRTPQLLLRPLLSRRGVPAALRRQAASMMQGQLRRQGLPRIDGTPMRWIMTNGETSPFVSGWSAPESGGRWSDGREAVMAFRDDCPSAAELSVTLAFMPFLTPRHPKAELDVFVNGEAMAVRPASGSGRSIRTFRVSARIRRGFEILLIAIRIRNPFKPARTSRLDQERRALGIFLQEVRFALTGQNYDL